MDSVHHPWTTKGAGPWWTGPCPVEGASPELSLAAALGHSSSPVVAQRKEGCTGSPSWASPGRGWWCGDRAMAVKKW
jgi:hypothetical protein